MLLLCLIADHLFEADDELFIASERLLLADALCAESGEFVFELFDVDLHLCCSL